MAAIARIGDINEVGGVITTGASTVSAGGAQLALIGSQVSPHINGGIHNSAVVTTGSGTVTCEGRLVAQVGSLESCGHHIVRGLDSVSST